MVDWGGQHRELMAQEQVLEHKGLGRAGHGAHGREQEPEEFEHTLSTADSAVRGFAFRQALQQRSEQGWRSSGCVELLATEGADVSLPRGSLHISVGVSGNDRATSAALQARLGCDSSIDPGDRPAGTLSCTVDPVFDTTERGTFHAWTTRCTSSAEVVVAAGSNVLCEMTAKSQAETGASPGASTLAPLTSAWSLKSSDLQRQVRL